MTTPQEPLRARFLLGALVTTPGAQAVLMPEEFIAALRRHVAGDWGELAEDDRKANEQSLIDGARLLSAYTSTQGQRFWVITEADRSVTTVLLPEEY